MTINDFLSRITNFLEEDIPDIKTDILNLKQRVSKLETTRSVLEKKILAELCSQKVSFISGSDLEKMVSQYKEIMGEGK